MKGSILRFEELGIPRQSVQKKNHKYNPKLLRLHLTLVRMVINTSTEDTVLVKTWGKQCLQPLLSGVSTNAVTMGISVGVPPKIKNRTTIW